jgi:hypothetical protein
LRVASRVKRPLRMMNQSLAYRAPLSPRLASIVATLVALAVAPLCACTDDAAPAPPGGTTVVPIEAAGTFSIRSSFALSAPPPGAADVLAELTAATDGPDDPSRFLVDLLVAKLPEGRTQVVAAAVAPYIAGYLQQRIDSFAPDLAAKLRGLADGLNQVARRFGTTESLTIDEAGAAQHVITGLGFGASGREVDIAFAPLGMADVAMQTQVTLEGSALAVTEHAAMIPYGAVLRLGLDRVVVPHLVPGALDLADAFEAVVDCDRLGAHVSELVGVGSADLYAGACTIALTRLAAEIYERLETAPVRISIAGSARAVDADGDGPMDSIVDGVWTGTFADAPLAPSVFAGTAR